MMKLALHNLSTLARRMLPMLVILLSLWALVMAGNAMQLSGILNTFLITLEVALVLMVGIGLFYLFFLLWKQMEDSFYSSRAYLIRTLPLSRLQIFGSYVISSLIALAVFLGLVALGIWLMAPEELNELIGMFPDVTWLLVLGLIAQTLLYLVAGMFGIVFGHRSGKSSLALMIGLGILLFYAVELISIGILALFNFETLQMMFSEVEPPFSMFLNVMWTLVGCYLVMDLFVFILCGWRVTRSADVE